MSEDPTTDDARLDAMLARLPRSIEPPPDLWSTIAAALDAAPAEDALRRLPQDAPPPDHLWARIAASIQHDRVRPRPRRLALPLAAAAAAVLLLIAVAELLSLRPAGVPEWPDLAAFNTSQALAEARDVYTDQIAVVRSEREAIETSLRTYPDDPSLLELWRYTYETELLLIDDATRVLANI
jgi:hypothetical protein